MAYFTQEMKKEKAPEIKELFKKFGVKGSMGVEHHSTFHVTIFQSNMFKETHGDNYSVNEHRISDNYKGDERKFLESLVQIMMRGNHNNSDAQRDYFDVGFYININIGRWDKPYIYNN